MISPASTLTDYTATTAAGPAEPSDATSVAAAKPDSRQQYTSLDVQLSGVGRAFGSRTVLRDVSLQIAPGEVLAILGSSGCGKSTLLRAVGGLDTGSTGEILINGSPVQRYDERTAVGFQEPRLLPWRSIHKNVSLGLPRSLSKAEGRERVDELLELVGLHDRASLRPREISGGMAQRASLARALARRPGVLLLDEPFGALDALTRLKMQDLLLDLHAQTGTTVLLVTHDVDEALQLADRVLLLGQDPADPDPAEGATIARLLSVPGRRPRDRASAELAALRGELFSGLGVDSHSH
ncbi:ABC transporter ATP-binding protein [Nesterenkonia sp. AY15]|uniref:ABC transporter ATP-binding protein n=1 Tax=unclassified Nesterenkonia TaxID=2629769 RepID=UPI001F4C938A|nr:MULTISPECIES: ABC transporter ATP-binding protein [unclassified Nesterenkonia]MCH8562293.1 ABC transporter ATP-binding protein [Nesterenkonia sp. YGD6]MCH8569804.1 ABC transporter ATP-binding protein [Nesterenkonia sp. AY15]